MEKKHLVWLGFGAIILIAGIILTRDFNAGRQEELRLKREQFEYQKSKENDWVTYILKDSK